MRPTEHRQLPPNEQAQNPRRWAIHPEVTWLRDGTGPVYVAIFTDLRARILLEPAATIWEILAQSIRAQDEWATVAEIMTELEKVGLLGPEQRTDAGITGDVERVLMQLQDMGAVRSVTA